MILFYMRLSGGGFRSQPCGVLLIHPASYCLLPTIYSIIFRSEERQRKIHCFVEEFFRWDNDLVLDAVRPLDIAPDEVVMGEVAEFTGVGTTGSF